MYEVSPFAPDLNYLKTPVTVEMIEHMKNERKRQILQQVPWIDLREWQSYEEKNPDPANWIPIPVIGVQALQTRVEAQVKFLDEQLRAVEKEKNNDWLNSAAADIHVLDQKINTCRRSKADLTNRLVGVLGRLERLKGRTNRGPRSSAEIKFQERLEKLRKAMDDPKGCKAKLMQIDARLGEIMSTRDRIQDFRVSRDAENKETDLDKERRNQEILNFLEKQRADIANLVGIVRRDTRDLRMMRQKLSS